MAHRQVVTVAFQSADYSAASLCFHDETDGVWTTPIRDELVFCGKNGFTENKTEGDMATPIGVFPIPFGFGIPFAGDLKIDYVDIVRHVWVDDPASQAYNTMQPADDAGRWASAEQLTIPSYKTVLVVGYNLPNPVPYKGSAIFIHCKHALPYTHGCVAMDAPVLRKLIRLLDREKQPVVVIDSAEAISRLELHDICVTEG